MNTLFSLGIILLGGLAAEKFVNRYNIPAITSYILLGIILGPHTLHITGDELIGATEILSNIVLGFIAFHLGENFSARHFRQIGKPVIIISLFAAILPWLLVTSGIFLLCDQPFHVAILYGAIAAATAPTATMMVVRQFRAKGLFTDLLLGIVAIDDAWGIMVFSLSLAIAQNLHSGGLSELAFFFVFLKASGDILFSLSLGALSAFLVSRWPKRIKQRGDILTFILGAILLNSGLAIFFSLSPLLTNMAFGAVLINMEKMSFRFFESIKSVDWPLYIIFYVLAGASFDIGLLKTVGFIGLIYILFRIIGKIGGAWLGGFFAGSNDKVRNYMGLAMMPQAGIALGLAIVAKINFPEVGASVFATITATTIIYEIIGPVATRYSLHQAGDI